MIIKLWKCVDKCGNQRMLKFPEKNQQMLKTFKTISIC